MVSNQALARSAVVVRGGLSGLAVLTVLAGCQTTPPPAPPAPPARVEAPAGPPERQQTAIEAALARESMQGSQPAPRAEPAPRVVLNADAPMRYTVQRGDTLWGIASMFLRDPWLWPEIWHVNTGIQNPHLIFPGDVLTLAYGADGSPQITLAAGDALRVQPLVRTGPLDGGAIPTIPYEAIAAFLGKPGLIGKDELNRAPRVAALRNQHVIAGAGSDVYVKGMKDHGPGRYVIVRVGDEMKDPESGRVLGYMTVYGGTAQVEEIKDVTRARIMSSARETAAGDVLLAEDISVVASDIIPRTPSQQIDGQIMAVVDGVSLIGQYSVVALNRGAQHGVAVGHVLAVDRAGGEVRDGSCRRSGLALCKGTVRLPDERAGSVLVFKTYDSMSYGLILSTTMPVAVKDRVRTP